MNVRLYVHVESTPSGPTWWAESPELPGFSAAASSLSELSVRAKWAVVDILRDDFGEDLDDFEIFLLPTEASTGNPGSTENPETGRGPGVVVTEQALAPA
jgi:hypothetical protein